jgi:hypothetical protein
MRKKNFYVKAGFVSVLCLLLLSAFMFIGCGSDSNGDSDSNSNNLTLSDLVGTYELTGLKVILADGTTSDDAFSDSWSGQMQITEDSTMTGQLIHQNEQTEFGYEIVEITDDSIHVRNSVCDQWMDIQVDADQLTTMYGDECASQRNKGSSMEIYWKKNNDNASVLKGKDNFIDVNSHETPLVDFINSILTRQ